MPTDDTSALIASHVPRPYPWIAQKEAMYQGWKHNLVSWLSIPLRSFGRCAPDDSFGILMYHRVCPVVRTLYPPTYNVRPEVFESQLKWLLQHGYEPWSLDRLIRARHEGEVIPPQAFAVTFDDGYANNYLYALPILSKLEIPATIFLATAFIGSEAPFPFDNWVATAGHESYPDAWKPLTLDQCHRMLDSGWIQFGCHTHTHQDFRNAPVALEKDLRISIEFLHREFGIESPTFAFPYGTPDEGFADSELAAVAKEVGCSCALQVGNSLVHRDDELFHWQRFDVASRDSGASIAAKLDGWSERVRGWWRTLRPTARMPITAPPSIVQSSMRPVSAPGWRTKLDRLMANGGGMALIDQGIVSGASFATSLLVGRCLGKESLGILFIALGVFTFLQCVIDQLVHVPFLVRSPHLSPPRIKQFIGSSLIHAAVATVVSVIAILLVSAWISWEHSSPPALPLALSLLAVVLPGMMLREFMHSMLHNQLRQSAAVRLDFTVALTQLVSLATLAWLDRLSIASCVLVIGGSATIMALLRLPRLWNSLEISSNLWTQDFLQNWQIGKWTLGSYLIGSSAPTFLPWILAYFHGAENTGLLAACLTLFGIAQTFLRGIGKFMAPQMAVSFAHGGRAELMQSIGRFTIFVTTIITLIALMLAIGGEYLVQVAFGTAYTGTAPVMYLLAVGCWLQAFDVVTGNSLLAVTRSDRNFRADCARCIITLGVAFWFVPIWGPFGVAFALVMGMMVGLTVRSWMLWQSLTELPATLESKEGSPCTTT